LIAPARHSTAFLTELWQQAEVIRREWLEVGLSTEPADRSTTEEVLASIYARHRRGRPRFRWVDSPAAALPFLSGLPDHAALLAVTRVPFVGRAPLASDIAAGLSRLRSDLAARVDDPPRDRPAPKRPKGEPWPDLPPAEAMRIGVPFLEILRQGVWEALFRSLARGVYLPIRSSLGLRSPDPLPVGWYGNQDAAWVGYFDTLRRLGLATFTPEFDEWAALVRAGGWWWPGEDECVVVERPAVLRVAPVPQSLHAEIRLSTDADAPTPAVVYHDGWSL
jgi:hypothetical protein